jgi:hypothetical protein
MYNWSKFYGGTIPEGYEVRTFCHSALMIRKIKEEELLTIDELYKASKRLKKIHQNE